jgi:DNA (cytosine-5)-methyltransferase 1
MNLALKKVYTVSPKAEKPRVWLHHIVCETAGYEPGQPLYVSIDEESQQIIIRNHPSEEDDHMIHVSSKKNETSGRVRPIVDTAREAYRSVVNVQQKVEICVYRKGKDSTVIVRPLRYRLFEKETLIEQERLVEPQDQRIRTLSIGSGAGFGTAAFEDTGYFRSVGAIEYEEDSAETFLYNFPSSFMFNGDLRDCNVVPKSDVAIVTLPCNEHSSLGDGEAGVFTNLALETAEIIRASQSRVIFFENVPAYYKSEAYLALKDLLMDQFPYWQEKNIEALDFGSLARRDRTYAVALKTQEDFMNFKFPVPPKSIRRKKLREYMDGKHVQHDWKPLDKWLASFKAKAEKNNSWKDRSIEKTFVTGDATEIQCIPKRYTGQSASSSYVLSEDKKSFRFLSIEEIRKILSVPTWFRYPDHIGKIRQYEMLGQSVDGRVFKAIANEIATMFYKTKRMVQTTVQQTKESINDITHAITLNSNGQIGFVL